MRKAREEVTSIRNKLYKIGTKKILKNLLQTYHTINLIIIVFTFAPEIYVSFDTNDTALSNESSAYAHI